MPENGPSGLSTPETYLGYGRLERFDSPEGVTEDVAATYSIPDDISEDHFAYGGTWTVMKEPALAGKNASIALNFKAKGVHLVMNTEAGEGTVEVLLDGKKISAEDAGIDVENGFVTVGEQRLFTLVSLDKVENHQLLVKMGSVPISVYAFSFD